VASRSFYGPLKAGHENVAVSLPLLPIWLSCSDPQISDFPTSSGPETYAQPLLRSCAKHETVSGRESLTSVAAAQGETSNNGRSQAPTMALMLYTEEDRYDETREK